AARRQRRWPNQVARPPAITPRIATTMMSMNSGIDLESTGSAELKGSNETVTECRFATAKVTRIRNTRMATRMPKNLRMTRLAWIETTGGGRLLAAQNLRAGLGIVAVQPLAHFLAGLEERNALLIDRNMGAGTRVAPGTRWTMLHR